MNAIQKDSHQMNSPITKFTLAATFSLSSLAQAAIMTSEGLNFPMIPPVNDISDTFAALPNINHVTVQDAIGDTANAPSDPNVNSWDIDKVSVAFDRQDLTLWIGIQVDGPDFGNSGGAPNIQELWFGEFVTGSINIGIDEAPSGDPDLWFGVYQGGNESDFSTAPFLKDGGSATSDNSTVNDYESAMAGDGGAPTSPLRTGSQDATTVPGTAMKWISSDEDGGNSFGFLIDLGNNPALSTFFPTTFTDQEYIFDFQIDIGSGNDTFGEDQVLGRLVVPEPTSAPLLALLLGLSITTRRKR